MGRTNCKQNAQASIFDEIIVDNFAGGGGASTGIELAAGRPVNISMRMLTPRELYNAMGFPPDYIIERDFTGRPYPKSQQVARCGNDVCPPMASAVVRANFTEWAVHLDTMRDLEKTIAI